MDILMNPYFSGHWMEPVHKLSHLLTQAGIRTACPNQTHDGLFRSVKDVHYQNKSLRPAGIFKYADTIHGNLVHCGNIDEPGKHDTMTSQTKNPTKTTNSVCCHWYIKFLEKNLNQSNEITTVTERVPWFPRIWGDVNAKV